MTIFKKRIHVLLSITFILCMFSSFSKANTMESNKETTRYTIFLSSNKCYFDLYINDLKMISNKDSLPTSTGFQIGQYLKPVNNVVRIDVWDPESKPGEWREDAECSVYIEGADPVKKLQPDSVTEINFFPPVKPDLAEPDKLFIRTTAIDTTVGKSPDFPQISFSPETARYTITREFDVREGFIEWPWYLSPTLDNPLPTEQVKKLQEAYQRVWQIFSNKDMPALRKAYHEMMYESSMFSTNSTEESYFNSAGFEKYFEDEFLKNHVLMPLNFDDKQLKFGLDQKIVSYSPTPILFCHKEFAGENFDIKYCFKPNPRFRFDGKEFVISR